MEVQPIDLTAVIATIMGISIVLIPVIGLTARHALKPLVESLGRLFQSRESEEKVRILERRMSLLEQQLETMDTTMTRLAEAAEFHQELRSGTGTALPRGDAAPDSARDRAPSRPPGERRS